jgi:hypothetical protein
MRRGAVCRVLAATATLLTTVLTGPALAATPGAAPHARGPARSATAAAVADVEITLRSMTPAIAAPGQPLTVAGTVRNTAATPIARPLVRVVLGSRDLRRREDIAAWASATGPADGSELGRIELPGSLAPGSTADFQVSVPRFASRGDATYGALPLSIEIGSSSLRTFAGYQRVKQYQPLRISWAVPLTLNADPDLFGAEGEERDAAWSRALGPGSRLVRILDATENLPVTWALDPTLTPTLLPEGDTLQEAASSTERVARENAETRIRTAATRHTIWVLPDTDGDVAAFASAGGGTELMGSLVARSVPVARALDGRDDIAWPVDGVHTAAREGALRRLYAGAGLAGQVAAQSALPDGANPSVTPEAARRSTGGLSVLAYDDNLSALLAQTTTSADGVLSAQRFMAESAALLDELPGTSGRTVFVAAPRTFDPDPQAASTFFQTVGDIPWLEQISTEDQLAAAERAVPMANSLATRPSSPPTTGGRPVLTRARAAALERSVATVRGVALIRDDGDGFARTWIRAAEQLASARWRTEPAAWTDLNGRIQAAARETTTAVKVSARTINFLAETGRLQITVTNDLDVAVENVKLTLDPANPRLRVDSPPALLRIGAKSRATVNVEVTAFAAGPVPIRTTLTTPDGTVIGQGADVRVQVTPTGDWVYWVLGALAGVILLLGVWRSLRRRPAQSAALPVEEAA